MEQNLTTQSAAHDHGHDHGHAHDHGDMPAHSHDDDHSHAHDHNHTHDHDHPHDHDHDHDHSHTHNHSHTHDPEQTRAIINRLKRSIGHLDKVRRMVEEGRDCTEVLVQLIDYIRTKKNVDLLTSVRMALRMVIGAYALAIIDKDNLEIVKR